VRRKQHRSLRGTECIGALLVQVGVDVSLLVFFCLLIHFVGQAGKGQIHLHVDLTLVNPISYTVLERTPIALFTCFLRI